jgi:hypothetical protein
VSDPKKHHYVPEFYLKGFCRNGKLWVYDRERATYDQLPPEALGIKKNFYSFTDENGQRDVSAEKELSRVENAAAPVIRKLEAKQRITIKERCDLALFVSLMRYRVPDFRQEHEEWHDTVLKAIHKERFPSVEAVKAELVRQGHESDEEFARYIFEMIRDETYDVKTNKPYSIAQMLDLGLNTAEQLANMRWLIIRAPKKTAFITSDDPFLLTPPRGYDPETSPYGVGVITPGAYKNVPLTQEIYLCIQDEGLDIAYWQADREVVRTINQDTAKSHRRFLFGRDKELLRKAASTTVPLPRPRPQIGHSRIYKFQGGEGD